ncbi:hypothetical protein [Wolbachia endosymbiont (group A) of Colletes cunicularius]
MPFFRLVNFLMFIAKLDPSSQGTGMTGEGGTGFNIISWTKSTF